MIAPYEVRFNNMSSRGFNTFTLATTFAFDSDDGETDTFLGRTAVSSESYNGVLNRTHNYKWSERFAPMLTFMKEDYSDFAQNENKQVLAWLTSKSTPGFLTAYEDDSNTIAFEVLGNFTEIKQYKIGNGRVVGYTAVFESLLPYPLSQVMTVEKTITNLQTFIIDCPTDDPESLVYPKITVQSNNSASIVITNNTLNTETALLNNINNEKITIDGANRVISSNRSIGRTFGSDFNWEWLPLKYGENQIHVTGNCTIKFEFRYPIKCGQYV